jgi:hypothetical protein
LSLVLLAGIVFGFLGLAAAQIAAAHVVIKTACTRMRRICTSVIGDPSLGEQGGDQMAEQTRPPFPSEGTVVIEHKGRTISGHYSATASRITVITFLGSKTARMNPLESVGEMARLMLRQLAEEGRI